MSASPRPLADNLFREHTDGTIVLVGGFSPSSGRTHFPRLAACPFTGADDVEEVMLPTDGTLWAWTAVTARPPGYEGPLPFGFGVVELSDGLRVITRLTEADPAALVFGQPMHLVAEVLRTDEDGTDVVTYAFAPDPSTTGAP
ncbi:MAG: Zn-ribbon domain-containing OB-fold protein [Actinomycetota bacterium]